MIRRSAAVVISPVGDVIKVGEKSRVPPMIGGTVEFGGRQGCGRSDAETKGRGVVLFWGMLERDERS